MVLPGEFLDPVGAELGPSTLLQHVISRVEPTVVHHLFKSGAFPGIISISLRVMENPQIS